jgi:predicted dehydrogenase
VKAVSIAVPTIHHLDAARPFLERGVACLIEKPLAPNSTVAREIVDLACKHHAPLMVGHIERYNPAVRAMLELGLKPAFIEVTRISPLTFRSIDVGVVLDMMIHDIDIVQLLAKSNVSSIDATGVSVIGGGPPDQRPAEDICNVRLRFESGCVANLTASRLALKTERKLRVFSADAYVSLDYQKRYGIVIRRGENLGQIRDVVRQIQVGEIEDLSQVNYAELVDVRELEMPEENGKHDPIRGQLEAFVGAVISGGPMPTPGEDGLAAVELAERIVEAMQRPSL